VTRREKSVLRRIFLFKRQVVTGRWSESQNMELNYLYSSTDMVREMKPRRMEWTGMYTSRGGDVGTARRKLKRKTY
jgi:hypothetical protein